MKLIIKLLAILIFGPILARFSRRAGGCRGSGRANADGESSRSSSAWPLAHRRVASRYSGTASRKCRPTCSLGTCICKMRNNSWNRIVDPRSAGSGAAR